MGRRSRDGMSGWHGKLDVALGAVVLFVAAYAPWGANTKVPWLTWVLVGACWAAGILWLATTGVRWASGGEAEEAGSGAARRGMAWRWTMGGMLVLMAALAGQIAVSAWNWTAVATVVPDGIEWKYREAMEGWPTTLDRDATWAAWVRYLGLAGFFWAARGWLGRRDGGRDLRTGVAGSHVSERMRRVIWAWALGGGLMALVGIVHRLDKGKELLWLMPLKDTPNEAMFGSFPYRANAGQYFNLTWPMVLGAWWVLRERGFDSAGHRRPVGASSFLVVCVALMIAGVFTAASRMAIAVALVQMTLSVFLLGATARSWGARIALAGGLLLALTLGWLAQGDFLRKRFENALVDTTLSGRTSIYGYARPMAERFPMWGWGAEAFRTAGELHRSGFHGNPEYVHDDRLETRGGLGWVGAGLVLGLLSLVPVLAWTGGTSGCPGAVRWGGAMGLGGMLVHGCVDYPFQVPSLQVAWVLMAAVLVAARWRRGSSMGRSGQA